jgi:hypothetical protein
MSIAAVCVAFFFATELPGDRALRFFSFLLSGFVIIACILFPKEARSLSSLVSQNKHDIFLTQCDKRRSL